MVKMLKWFFMLSKRLYKKPSFVILMLLVPICMLAFSFVAKQSGGFIRIVLAQTDSNDAISSEVIKELMEKDSLIQFTTAVSDEDAILEVKNGLADEAWIFAADTNSIINEFPSKSYAVSIVTKEQNVALRLAREKLSGALYKYCAKTYYIDYIRTHLKELDTISDEKLMVYFQNAKVDETLFEYKTPSNMSANINDSNYLTSPIRGLLAILAVLCALAATMYYKQDEMSGTFSHIKDKHKELVAFGCVMTAVVNISVMLCISLLVSSLVTSISNELMILLLYSICCTSFCLLLKSMFTSLQIYSALIPLLTVVFIGLCPVFFDFRKFYILQMLLPPTYYVNAVYDDKFLIYMIVYSAICIVLSMILNFSRAFARKFLFSM